MGEHDRGQGRFRSVNFACIAAFVACGCGQAPDDGSVPVEAPVNAPDGSLRAAYIGAVQTEAPPAYAFANRGDRAVARNAGQGFAVGVGAGSVELDLDDGAHVALRWSRHGRGAPAEALPEGEATIDANRATIARSSGAADFYVNGPLGVEQGFVLAEPPAGSGPLVLAVEVTAEPARTIEAAGDGIVLRPEDGGRELHYTDLFAHDASGRALPGRMVVADAIELYIDDRDAQYPIAIDPLVWVEQQKLLATDGAAADELGFSVALSGDSAILGAHLDDDLGADAGSAYVFVRSGSLWNQQQKLVASDGAAGDQFGFSVALSGDTAVIGAPWNDGPGLDAGAAYTFVRSNGIWSQEQKLVAVDAMPNDGLGSAVGLDGNTALIGAPYDDDQAYDAGSVYVFVRSGAWLQQQKLLASDGTTARYLGLAVSIDADTAIVAGRAAYAFVRNDSTWSEQQKLSDLAAPIWWPAPAVAVDADTALVGDPNEYPIQCCNDGRVHVYVRNGSTWSLQQTLDGSLFGMFGFGRSVALRGDFALAGTAYNFGTGSAHAFRRAQNAWSLEKMFFAGDQSSGDYFGVSVAATADTVLAGAYRQDDNGQDSGAAYVFVLPGGPCVSDAQCATGFCVDGVCCTSACGGGDPTDCQACSSGTCIATNLTACDDGNACTQVDSCSWGTCTGSSPVVCTALDACHLAGSCDPQTGTCSNPSKPDGSACSDGTLCTQGDSCQSGGCASGAPVVCLALDACHLAGSCDPQTGTCSNPAKPNGSACDDGNLCSLGDTCQGGSCSSGAPVVCTPLDQCHSAGTCNPQTGMCSNPSMPNATPCFDGDACTNVDACQNGACSGVATICTALDACHDAGTCDPSTGVCSDPPSPDGTACDDADICTEGDACGAGSCMAGTPCPDGSSCTIRGCVPDEGSGGAGGTGGGGTGGDATGGDATGGDATGGDATGGDATGGAAGGGAATGGAPGTGRLDGPGSDVADGCSCRMGSRAPRWHGLVFVLCGLLGLRRRLGQTCR
jgi:FG-GAP repeat protein